MNNNVNVIVERKVKRTKKEKRKDVKMEKNKLSFFDLFLPSFSYYTDEYQIEEIASP